MGTRSTTTFLENDKPIACLYRQFDGYPDGHGIDLAKALGDREMTNGISGDRNVFNRMGDLAVRVIATLKAKYDINSPGNFYMEIPGTDGDHGEDYLYYIYTDDPQGWEGYPKIKIERPYSSEILFDGTVEEFNVWVEDYKS